MKSLLFIIVSFIAFINQVSAETIIRGKVKNAEENQIQYFYRESIVSKMQFAIVDLVNDEFELRLDLLDAIEFQFTVNDNHIDFFILPEDSFEFAVDANDVANTLTYQCKNMEDQKYTTGLSALESIKYLAMKPYKIKGTGWNTPDGFIDSLTQIVAAKKKEYIAGNYEKINFSRTFRKEVLDTTYKSLLSDVYTKSMSTSTNMRPVEGTVIITDDELSRKIADATLEQPDLLRNETYMLFLYWNESIEYKKWITEQGKKGDADFWNANRIPFQNKLYKNDAVKYAIMAYVNGRNNRKNADLYIANLRQIEQLFPNGDYNYKMKKIENSLAALREGQIAPAFTLKNLEGKDVSLKDFSGKVVYIDFWASWCLPCVMENKKVKDLKPIYADKDVVFLYITRDQSESVWKDAIAKQEIDGVHLMGGGLPVFDVYKADGVPKYVLIGKDGKIVSADAPRPSEKERLMQMFDAELLK